MAYCCVPNCGRRRINGVTLFRMPEETNSTRNEWIKFLIDAGFKESDLNVDNYICEDHFEDELIVRNNYRTVLKKNSVPTFPVIEYYEEDDSLLDESLQESFSINFQESSNQCFDHLIEIAALKDEVNKYKKLYSEMRKKYEELDSKLRRYFGDDQFRALSNKSGYVMDWSSTSVKKSIMLQALGGSRALGFCKKFVAPLPSERTVQRSLEDFLISPGILYDVIEMINMKVVDFSSTQLRMGILFDEKAIIEGESLEPKSKNYYGKLTLPVSQEFASNVLVFLLVGVEIRTKDIVAFHFTSKKKFAREQADFLIELIKVIEERTPIKIDFIVHDCGAANTGMINALGKSLSKNDRDPFIDHPVDSERKLFFLPDAEHDLKNIIAALRNHDATIPNNFVIKYNLSSDKVCMKEVKKLLNIQNKSIFKPAPKLTTSILAPSHFEKMSTSTFENLLSPEVIASLEYISKEFARGSSKNNPTCWILTMLNKWRKLTAYETIILDNRNTHMEFLLEMSELFYTIKFGNKHLTCQNGAAWASIGIVKLFEFWHQIGMESVQTSRLLQNALESVFSIIASYQSSPSAVHIIHALKKIIVTNFLSDPIRGSYKWDNDTIFDSKICFIEHLKDKKKEAMTPESKTISTDNIVIPEMINSMDLFKHDLETQTFSLEISNLITPLFSIYSCETCLNNYTAQQNENELVKLLQASQSIQDRLIPSSIFLSFCYKIESIFRQIDVSHNCESSECIQKILIEIVKTKIPTNFNHCDDIFVCFLSNFVSMRMKLSHKSRFPHRKQKFASQFK